MLAQTPINYIIFCITVIRTFRSIYINCFNRLRFLAEVISKLQKMHFFGKFKDHKSERKHWNWTNDHIFSSTFSTLTVCNIRFYITKWSKFIFMWSPLWSVKYLNFGQNLPIQTAHHTFRESRHPEVTKNRYYVLSPKVAKKR